MKTFIFAIIISLASMQAFACDCQKGKYPPPWDEYDYDSIIQNPISPYE